MKLVLDKPWIDLTEATALRLPGQLGVYQLADAGGAILRIGFAGGKELFGLRSALQRELSLHPPGTRFRYEVNTQYQSRWRELLMLHKREFGDVPPGNEADKPRRLGSLG